MKIFRIIIGVLCVVSAGICQEDHKHQIEKRVLENQAGPGTILTPENSELNLTKNVNESKLSPSSVSSTAIPVSANSSAKLEQQLNALASSGSSTANNFAKSNQTVGGATALPQAESNKTVDVPLVKVNVTSLLRTNSSASPVVENPQFIGVVSNTSTNVNQLPKVFPNGTSVNGTKIRECDLEKSQTSICQQNSTAREAQNDINTNQTAVDTEVADLYKKIIKAADSYKGSLRSQKPVKTDDKINDDTELINNGQNTEDELRSHKKSGLDDNSGVQQRYLAAVVVSSLVAVSVLCYAALLVWRRYLENRYGSRTMLVNEEEFDDPNDLRHFSI